MKVLLAWDDRGVDVLTEPKSRSTCKMKATGWLKGLVLRALHRDESAT
jgi:hypothetical protein